MPSPLVPILLFWDYDTQWGGDRSRSAGGPKNWGYDEFVNTERLLEMQAEYDVASCFAVVGSAALDGERPYHDPAQIRLMHQMGHEVASHTHRHEWIPGLREDELYETLRSSKDALEQCIGAEVSCLVPPYNQPFDYLGGLSISVSERRQVGKHRVDLRRLCQCLRELDYRFCRVSYRTLSDRIVDRFRAYPIHRPSRLGTIAGIRCVQTNACGFDAKAMAVLDRCLEKKGMLVIYGHPHSLSNPTNQQCFEFFEKFLQTTRELRREGKVKFVLPRDLVRKDVVREDVVV